MLWFKDMLGEIVKGKEKVIEIVMDIVMRIDIVIVMGR